MLKSTRDLIVSVFVGLAGAGLVLAFWYSLNHMDREEGSRAIPIPEPDPVSNSDSRPRAVDAVPTVVKIAALGAQRTGSGVVISEGLLLSAWHVTQGGVDVLVGRTQDKEVVPGKVVAEFEDFDLVVISAPGVGCPCARIANRVPELYSDVIRIGYAGSMLEPYVSSGTVFRVHPDAEAVPSISSSALAVRGSSGGGLFQWRDGEWFLIGLTRSRYAERDGEAVSGLGNSTSSILILEVLGLGLD